MNSMYYLSLTVLCLLHVGIAGVTIVADSGVSVLNSANFAETLEEIAVDFYAPW